MTANRAAQAIAILLAITFLWLPAGAFASGGTGEYRLPWKFEGEGLFYHSCGMADACWVAEIRPLRGAKKIKARLRCDGTQRLALTPADTSERVFANNCQQTNTDDKPSHIAETLLKLLGRP